MTVFTCARCALIFPDHLPDACPKCGAAKYPPARQPTARCSAKWPKVPHSVAPMTLEQWLRSKSISRRTKEYLFGTLEINQ